MVAYARRYRAKPENRKKMTAHMRRYRAKPGMRKKIAAEARARYAANPDPERTRCREFNRRHKEQIRLRRMTEEYKVADRARQKKYRLKKPEVRAAINRRFRINHPDASDEATKRWRRTPRGQTFTLLTGARKRARQFGVEFSLTYEDLLPILQKGRCQRTGIIFSPGYGMGLGGNHPFTPSLDRIDRSRGYSKDNVQIVVWIYNRAKGVDSDADVLRMAEALIAQARPPLAVAG
jgi:hypothetical protein